MLGRPSSRDPAWSQRALGWVYRQYAPIWRRLTQLVQLILISVEKKIMILVDLVFSIFAKGKTLPLDEDFA
jgi:hypothetical protein